MHDGDARLGLRHRLPADHVHALVLQIFVGAGEALLLDARDVGDVSGLQRLGHFGGLMYRGPALLHKVHHVLRHRQFRRRDVAERHLPVRQHLGKRVYRAAILQVAHHRHVQAIQRTQVSARCARRAFTLNRIQIQQRLGGVLACAVARVNHRYRSGIGQRASGASGRVSLCDDVGVRFQHASRIVDRLSLGCAGGGLGLGHADHAPAQTVHRALERQARAGARLVEHGSQDVVAQKLRHVVALAARQALFKFGGLRQNGLNLVFAEVAYADDVAVHK